MNIRPLSKELQEIALNELNEVPSRIEDDLKQIREWLQKQPHLHVRSDDQWLLNFLRCSKFSIQRTKERLDFYYTMRTLAPEFFSNRDPLRPEIQDILKRGFMVQFKSADPAGPLISMIRWDTVDSEKNSMVNLLKVILMGLDILLQESDNFSVVGIIALEDLSNFGFNYVIQQTPAVSKKFLLSVQNAFPIRLKQFHCFNIPSYFETALNILKPFMSEKLKNRLMVYGKNEFKEIYKNVPASVMPKEYGGEGASFDDMAAEFREKMESYRDWFLEDAQYSSDETKRLGKPKTASDVFGVEGSFRKLNVD